MKSALAVYAFDALVAKLEHRETHSLLKIASVMGSEAGKVDEDESSPLFVTWNTVVKGGKDVSLRGCIGTFEPLELLSAIPTYSLNSALQDPRFRPIGLKEIPNLECGVTVLRQFEKISDPLDWELGTHGIRVVFDTGFGRPSATFLPDVAVEQGWDKEETLLHLAAKAGVPAFTFDRLKEMVSETTRYQGAKSAVRYADYKDIIAKVEAADN